MKHLISAFIIFSLPFDNEKDAIYDLSFQTAACVVYLVIKDFKSSFCGVVKLRWSSVGMHNEINHDFFDFIILCAGKSFDKILNPHLCMILNVLSNHFV